MSNSEKEKTEKQDTKQTEINENSTISDGNSSNSKKSKKTAIKTIKKLTESHKSVSVAEFFEKNRHLLGFNNPAKSLITSVKEAVDNSLDACEENNILPEIYVEIKPCGTNKYRMVVEDNGPGIKKKHLLKSFGKLLYGSKFRSHGGKQGRGQQGIGISAVILYGQLTTGKKAVLISKTKKDDSAHMYILGIDVKTNEPEIENSETYDWDEKEHGIRIEVEMVAKNIKSKQSVDEYIRETAVVNPHAKITYINPEGEKVEYPRVNEKLPKKAKTIKPHPHGIELGILKRMIKDTKSRNIKSFLCNEFDRVGAGSAKAILEKAELDPRILPRLLTSDQQEKLLEIMQNTKLMNPTTDCLSPIGAKAIEDSISAEYDVDFVHSITRPPSVYRGNPFQVEVAIGYGGSLNPEGYVDLVRFANKVPLLYQEGACAITQSVKSVSWKSYGLSQSGTSLPIGPAVILIHLASVWVPFTSEGKEAVSSYPEITKEIKLAIQECGRSLQRHISKKKRGELEEKKRQIFKNYSTEVATAIYSLTNEKTYKYSNEEMLEKSKDIHANLLKIAESMYSTGKDETEESEVEEAEADEKREKAIQEHESKQEENKETKDEVKEEPETEPEKESEKSNSDSSSEKITDKASSEETKQKEE